MTRILFVCAGNICRSPMAEAILVHKVRIAGREHEFEIDSAGTGAWHIGERPDPRTIAELARNGIGWVSRARQVRPDDVTRFDLILAADRANLRDLERFPGYDHARVGLLLGQDEVPDPYTGDADDFRRVFELCEPACDALLARSV